MHAEVRTRGYLPERADKYPALIIVANDVHLPVPPPHHVVDCAGKSNEERADHVTEKEPPVAESENSLLTPFSD